MTAVRFVLSLALLSLMSGCGFSELPKAKSGAETALQGALTAYRSRADLVPAVVKVAQSHKDPKFQALAQELVKSHAQVVGLDKPAADMTEQDLSRFQSFQVNLSVTLGRFFSLAEQDKALSNAPELLSAKSQLHVLEVRIASTRQESMRLGKAYNQQLLNAPTKWFNAYYKFKSLPAFENTAEPASR